MSRNRYARNEALLHDVVRDLESLDAGAHRRAIDTLARFGPLPCEHGAPADPAEVSLIRAELLAYLETITRGRVGRIGTIAAVHFTSSSQSTTVSAMIRDAAVLQMVILVREVGTAALRLCPAPASKDVGRIHVRGESFACGRMFVKSYRRAFCSDQCQKRAYMRERRANEKLRRTRAARRRRPS